MAKIYYDLIKISKDHLIRVLKTYPDKPVKSKYAFFIVPGNPGLIEFYEFFALELTKRTGYPVVGISHTGQVYDVKDQQASWPPLKLKAQVLDKVKFIEENVYEDEISECGYNLGIDKETKLILIGHSVGCYCILQILNKLNDKINRRVVKTMHLFPTVERMSTTPNGRILTFVGTYLFWLVYSIAYLLSRLPAGVQKFLIDFGFTKRHHKRSLADNIDKVVYGMCTNYNTGRSCFYMGFDEMKNVLELNESIVGENADRLIFYYGRTDRWSPMSYYHDMMKRVDRMRKNSSSLSTFTTPLPVVLLDDKEMDHAFVIYKDQCLAIIDKISEWIKDL